MLLWDYESVAEIKGRCHTGAFAIYLVGMTITINKYYKKALMQTRAFTYYIHVYTVAIKWRYTAPMSIILFKP